MTWKITLPEAGRPAHRPETLPDVWQFPIVVGLGANLPSPSHGAPAETLTAALGALEGAGIGVLARSSWFESAPVPASDQPWFVNGIAVVETGRSPEALLGLLLRIEAEFGRTRGARNEARILDLDLIAFGEVVRQEERGIQIPHPRLQYRAFVLAPLAEILPDWVHPVSRRPVPELLAAIPGDQAVRRLETR